ncbi:hypothetical protein [Oceanicola sp. S124]|uniref:hypothetical protein n=1 Tax=Oceanicola sp. S124 TaxID=1042378 RepID=UPI000255A9B8|nr:hypothetical protein [Oceanicola sp. S124]
MLELPTQARPLFAPELRHNPAEPEVAEAPHQRPPTEERPLPEPAGAREGDLQPSPLPDPAPVAEAEKDGTPQEEGGTVPVVTRGDGSSAASASPPSRLDAMSLFQGMLAEATRSGANVPGTSMHIYALVRQLSQLVVQNEMELAA